MNKYKKEEAQIEIVRNSELFDERWYVTEYQDVFKALKNPARHYYKNGWKEGRNPSEKFNTSAYIKEHPELIKLDICPIYHYEKMRSDNKLCHYKLIENSEYFDSDWYLKTYKEVSEQGLDPIEHYLTEGWQKGYNPSLYFDNDYYINEYKDVKNAQINPLVHYEMFGKLEGRNTLPLSAVKFPIIARSFIYEKKTYLPKEIKRMAIFASYSDDGRISDNVLYYLKNLRKVCDAIIFVSDNPLYKEEFDKIKRFVIYMAISRHGEYDFGSYKRGYLYALEKGLLDKTEELILCNDSCYGPIYPFEDVFNVMEKNNKYDFWGITDSHEYCYHIQSYFLVMTRKVFMCEAVKSFMQSIKAAKNYFDVISDYEIGLSRLIKEQNFTAGAYINNNGNNKNIAQYPLLLLEKHSPLLKRKIFNLYNFSHENTVDALNKVRVINRTVYEYMKQDNIYNADSNHSSEDPLISVVVFGYNTEVSISETLDNLLTQTYKNFEIIIVDDGSDENILKILRQYARKYGNIYLYRHRQGKKMGRAETIRLGIHKSRGDYIAFCEVNDLWMENHLEEKVKLIKSYKNVNIIINDVQISGDDKLIKQMQKILEEVRALFYGCIRRRFSMIETNKMNIIPTLSSFMISKKILLQFNLHPIYIENAWDRWIYRQALIENDVWFVPLCLTEQRMHRESHIEANDDISVENIEKFEQALNNFLMKKYPFYKTFAFRFELAKKKISEK